MPDINRVHQLPIYWKHSLDFWIFFNILHDSKLAINYPTFTLVTSNPFILIFIFIKVWIYLFTKLTEIVVYIIFIAILAQEAISSNFYFRSDLLINFLRSAKLIEAFFASRSCWLTCIILIFFFPTFLNLFTASFSLTFTGIIFFFLFFTLCLIFSSILLLNRTWHLLLRIRWNVENFWFLSFLLRFLFFLLIFKLNLGFLFRFRGFLDSKIWIFDENRTGLAFTSPNRWEHILI